MSRLAATAHAAGLTLIAVSPAAFAESGEARPVVRIGPSGFEPHIVSVRAGTEIEFVNTDHVPHSIIAKASETEVFRSPEWVDEGESYFVRLSTPGEITFSCGQHHGMKGRITVVK